MEDKVSSYTGEESVSRRGTSFSVWKFCGFKNSGTDQRTVCCNIRTIIAAVIEKGTGTAAKCNMKIQKMDNILVKKTIQKNQWFY